MTSSTTAKKPKIVIDTILGRGRALKRVDGGDGLTVALILSKNHAKLERLESLIDKERKFQSADTRRFNEIMNELFYDSLIHFGSNNHWLALSKSKGLTSPVPRGIVDIFPKNTEAARALMAEMAQSWASGDVKTSGNISMKSATVRKEIEAMRKSPESVMRFIGGLYANGRYRRAAVAFRHAQRLGYKTIKSHNSLPLKN